MNDCSILGKVNSIQSLGTVDGPGVRFVVFMQGCNLRCGCCHNPDTWDISGGTEYSPAEIADKAERYKNYFGKDGGITVSGGEPLLQAEFVAELFRLCHKKGINTCLDTSGSIINDSVLSLLKVTDRVLLDIKYTDNNKYIEYVGCSIDKPLKFLSILNDLAIPTTLRQVIIPTLNDTSDNILKLKKLSDSNDCVDKTELLPFKKICKVKYDNMGLVFRFENLPIPDDGTMEHLNSIL